MFEFLCRFLRDKLQFFLRSKQFHGKVTDEDLALALLARSQNSTTASGVLQSSMQVEQLLTLVQMAQSKQQVASASSAGGASGKPIQVNAGSTKAQKNAAAAALAAANSA